MGWKDLPYWLKGGIIGLVFALTLSLVFLSIHEFRLFGGVDGLFNFIIWIILVLVPGLLINIFFNFSLGEKALSTTFQIFVFSSIFYFILGSIIGWIVGKIKGGNKK